MFTQHRIGLAAVALVLVAGSTIFSARASADDARVTVAPAVYRVDETNSGVSVQTVQWYGRSYGPYYRPYYYRPYYRPYYGGYYRPYYYGYGYGYPAYGYTYGYPAYGYYSGYGPGVGVSVGRVGVGMW
jgi:hypothetical protein